MKAAASSNSLPLELQAALRRLSPEQRRAIEAATKKAITGLEDIERRYRQQGSQEPQKLLTDELKALLNEAAGPNGQFIIY